MKITNSYTAIVWSPFLSAHSGRDIIFLKLNKYKKCDGAESFWRNNSHTNNNNDIQ